MKAFVQWKGTEVCADLTCECGAWFHIDAKFAYFIKCPECHKTFAMPEDLVLTETVPPNDAHVVKDWADGLDN